MKRAIRYVIVGIAVLLVAVPIFLIFGYLEEDWRGARDWAACQRDLAAKGETLDLRQLVPPGNPSDDLSKVPIFAELYQKEDWEKARIRNVRVSLNMNATPKVPKAQYLRGQAVDLAAWQKFYRSEPKSHLPETPGTPAQDVLQTLSQFDPELNEVDAALSNPNAFFPVDYDLPARTPLSGVTSMIAIAQILQLKGIAHLENQQADLAEKDYLFSFRICQPLTKGCFLVNYLVIVGVRAIDDAILWEGIHRHAWNDAQLRGMESALAATDMLALGEQTLKAERGFGIRTNQYVQDGHYNQMTDMSADPSLKDRWAEFELLAFVESRPRGWALEELVFQSREMQRLIDSINLSDGTLNPQVYNEWRHPDFLADWTQLNFITPAILLSGLEKSGQGIARAVTYQRLARLACRLEEYYLAHNHQYPEKLEDLSDLPPHLNQEVLSEQPFHYQRKGDSYTLYSVGWDQKDDGGALDPHNDKSKGDWPWPGP